MGEPGDTVRFDYFVAKVAELRAVRLARMDPGTPTPSLATDGLDTEELMSLYQAAVIEQNERLLFIAHMALTAAQTAVPDDARTQMLHEISAACRGEFPSWWPAFKKEHRIGEPRG